MDPRQSAKEKICAAMIALLQKTEFRKISVKQIIAEANVNRSSFYYHFGNTIDVLDYIIKEFVRKYNFSPYPIPDVSSDYSMTDIFLLCWRSCTQYAYEHQDVVHILVQPEYRYQLFKEFENSARNLLLNAKISYKVLDGEEQVLNHDNLFDFLSYKNAAIQLCTLDYLVTHNFIDPPDKIAEVFSTAFNLTVTNQEDYNKAFLL